MDLAVSNFENPFQAVDPDIMDSFVRSFGTIGHLQIVSHIVSFSNNPNLKLVSKVFQAAWRNISIKKELIIGMDNYLEIEEIPKNLQHVIISSCKKVYGNEDYGKFLFWFYENCSNASRVTIKDFHARMFFMGRNFLANRRYVARNLLYDYSFDFFENLPNLQILTCEIGMFPDIFHLSEVYQPRWELATELKIIKFYIPSENRANKYNMPDDYYFDFDFTCSMIREKVQGIAFLKFRSQNPCFSNLETVEVKDLTKSLRMNKEQFFDNILSGLRDSLKDESNHPLRETSCTIQEVEDLEKQVVVPFEREDRTLKAKFFVCDQEAPIDLAKASILKNIFRKIFSIFKPLKNYFS